MAAAGEGQVGVRGVGGLRRGKKGEGEGKRDERVWGEKTGWSGRKAKGGTLLTANSIIV